MNTQLSPKILSQNSLNFLKGGSGFGESSTSSHSSNSLHELRLSRANRKHLANACRLAASLLHTVADCIDPQVDA